MTSKQKSEFQAFINQLKSSYYSALLGHIERLEITDFTVKEVSAFESKTCRVCGKTRVCHFVVCLTGLPHPNGVRHSVEYHVGSDCLSRVLPLIKAAIIMRSKTGWGELTGLLYESQNAFRHVKCKYEGEDDEITSGTKLGYPSRVKTPKETRTDDPKVGVENPPKVGVKKTRKLFNPNSEFFDEYQFVEESLFSPPSKQIISPIESVACVKSPEPIEPTYRNANLDYLDEVVYSPLKEALEDFGFVDRPVSKERLDVTEIRYFVTLELVPLNCPKSLLKTFVEVLTDEIVSELKTSSRLSEVLLRHLPYPSVHPGDLFNSWSKSWPLERMFGCKW